MAPTCALEQNRQDDTDNGAVVGHRDLDWKQTRGETLRSASQPATQRTAHRLPAASGITSCEALAVCVCVCNRSYVRTTLPKLMLGPYQGTACTTAASTTRLCIKHRGNKGNSNKSEEASHSLDIRQHQNPSYMWEQQEVKQCGVIEL